MAISMIKRTLPGLLAASLSMGALAEGDFSAGIKLGKMDPDNGDNETAMGIQLGYGVNNRIRAELEFMQADFGNTDVDSTAIYGTYRSQGDIYLLGKIGFASVDVGNDSDSGLSYGLGAGIATSSTIAIEIEYTALDSDLNFIGFTGKLSF